MKLRRILAALMLASLVFTACQSKSNNTTDTAVTDSISAPVVENAMPDVTIERADGTTLQLSSLFGKTLYLDFWATWCPPCCAEIPHLKKLSEKLADNKDIRIISISVDQDREAWVKKINADKPAWEQYRISAEKAEAFFGAIKLETIPRFIIVGTDGSIINADAPRPSDENCAATIQKAISASL
ncbi:MAG: TlpA family protein disulfide reductase [Bacteroidaceae bacterium]|nr:TlpA family protein disulfide reductase [Bacteroidaceae bacterium]